MQQHMDYLAIGSKTILIQVTEKMVNSIYSICSKKKVVQLRFLLGLTPATFSVKWKVLNYCAISLCLYVKGDRQTLKCMLGKKGRVVFFFLKSCFLYFYALCIIYFYVCVFFIFMCLYFYVLT